ncbi:MULTISPECIES: TetR family transcriptional regulator [Pseudomonas]|jgi:TetR/AcrR family transcriptional repressor of mexAB-oprM operon|uniref:TetR family transcriptional regulator n=1 Tax=Pseudomonas oryzihabitans TaxID=47885 RepID=A0A0U4P3Z8_9PSED|nr:MULTISPECIES: TetR family transcriptional regulator [Pseudomonas]ALZ83519.1 TetR family transcriptional regulator [Pseudomonas oryzihabitans]WCE08304.1 TetR family transcriptional regulator [Pseudomonas sp. JBR1]
MRRTKEEAEQTRQAILDAAEALFLTNGVARTSLEMIARECGVTRGAVYWHFQNKAHLFHEMLSQIRIPADELTERLRVDGEEDSLQRLFKLCIEGMEKFTKPGREQRVMTIMLHRCEFTEELREAEERDLQFLRQFIRITDALFTAQAARLQPGVTPQLASRLLHSLFLGTLSDLLRDEQTFAPLLATEQVFTTFFRAIVRDWAQSATV